MDFEANLVVCNIGLETMMNLLLLIPRDSLTHVLLNSVLVLSWGIQVLNTVRVIIKLSAHYFITKWLGWFLLYLWTSSHIRNQHFSCEWLLLAFLVHKIYLVSWDLLDSLTHFGATAFNIILSLILFILVVLELLLQLLEELLLPFKLDLKLLLFVDHIERALGILFGHLTLIVITLEERVHLRWADGKSNVLILFCLVLDRLCVVLIFRNQVLDFWISSFYTGSMVDLPSSSP